MKLRHTLIVTLVIISFTFVGCGKDQASVNIVEPIVLPGGGSEVVTAQNTFGLKLFKELLQQDQDDGNKLISPLSIHMDFCMAYNGASGKTKDEMGRALEVADVPVSLLNSVNNTLINGLPAVDPKVAIHVANSIWYRNTGAQPLPGFIQSVSDAYEAQIAGLDFNDPATLKKINSWVSEKTKRKIDKIIDKIDSDDIMYLVNAVYFKGRWKMKFDGKQTKNRAFYKAGNLAVQTPFMTQTAALRYAGNQSMQIVELPYGSGSYSMYIILPGQDLTPESLVSSFDENILKNTLASLDSTVITVYLPKWKSTYEIKDMKPLLWSLGMEEAFSAGNADFSQMYDPGVGAYISKALHKTFIAVDEEGTEAAAVTSIGMTTTSTGMLVMDINRPFLYLIAERQTGSVLFLGEVNDPSK